MNMKKGTLRSTLTLAGGLFFLLTATLALAAPAKKAAGPGKDDPALQKVLSRFDQVQQSIRSMSAEFTQTTINPLFKEPMLARGRFYLSKPDSVLWEYTMPEVMRFAIAGGEYTGYFPGRKRAERRDVRRWTEQIFRFFALGQGSAELRKFYDIRLETPESDKSGTYLLVLDPRKHRVRKRVEEVRLWVHASTCLPAKVEYVNHAGATRTLVFKDVQLNPDLSASLFRVKIPSDVTVTKGFTEIGSAPPGPVAR